MTIAMCCNCTTSVKRSLRAQRLVLSLDEGLKWEKTKQRISPWAFIFIQTEIDYLQCRSEEGIQPLQVAQWRKEGTKNFLSTRHQEKAPTQQEESSVKQSNSTVEKYWNRTWSAVLSMSHIAGEGEVWVATDPAGKSFPASRSVLWQNILSTGKCTHENSRALFSLWLKS